jgi:hypothetical protein
MWSARDHAFAALTARMAFARTSGVLRTAILHQDDVLNGTPLQPPAGATSGLSRDRLVESDVYRSPFLPALDAAFAKRVSRSLGP